MAISITVNVLGLINVLQQKLFTTKIGFVPIVAVIFFHISMMTHYSLILKLSPVIVMVAVKLFCELDIPQLIVINV